MSKKTERNLYRKLLYQQEKNAKLEALNTELVEACEEAILIKNLTARADWLARHSDDLDTDAYYGDADELNKQVAEIEAKIRAAIQKARGK